MKKGPHDKAVFRLSRLPFQKKVKALAMAFAVLAVVILCQRPVQAASTTEAAEAANEAAMKMVQACKDPGVPLDENAVATLIDYVIGPKQSKQYGLPKMDGCPGAFMEFDMRTSFSRLVEYSCNPFIPAAVTRPSSLRYSTWLNPKGGSPVLPARWKPVPSSASPLIVRGMQREADSPDLHTGVYHQYDLKRMLVFVNHRGRQALISVSKQVNTSDVGKKGVTLGEDNDWTYYYSDEPGTMKRGMGWAKSYIYDYFSVGVYVERSPGQTQTRNAVFQWLRAGWSGINFVRSNHILNGMKRFAKGFTTVLESPRLPASVQIVSAYQSLLHLSSADLLNRYTLLQQSLKTSAIRLGKIPKSDLPDNRSFALLPREQMAEELMVDYIRTALGKKIPLPKEPVEPGE